MVFPVNLRWALKLAPWISVRFAIFAVKSSRCILLIAVNFFYRILLVALKRFFTAYIALNTNLSLSLRFTSNLTSFSNFKRWHLDPCIQLNRSELLMSSDVEFCIYTVRNFLAEEWLAPELYQSSSQKTVWWFVLLLGVYSVVTKKGRFFNCLKNSFQLSE